jgi:uncharacterized protein (UPF0147 family)
LIVARANISNTTAAVLAGDEDLTEWSDEELLAGKRRNKRGTLSGGNPKVVPRAILQELTRRRFLKAEEVVKSSLVSAVELWKQIVEDETVPHPIRLRASELIVDRCWGKATERIDASVDIREPAWLSVLRRAAVVNGTPAEELPAVRRAMGTIPATSEPVEDIVDAEIVQPDDDDPILEGDDVVWEED